MPDVQKFPDYFRAYHWNDKHRLFGYPADVYPSFSWINVLEQRFKWLRANCTKTGTASIYLLKEMLQWGGSQNGVLQKFEDQIGEVNVHSQVERVILDLASPSDAVASALQLPGMGLTYASKFLRFLAPEDYGALDSRLRGALQKRLSGKLASIYDGNVTSMRRGFEQFTAYLTELKAELEVKEVLRPDCQLPRADSRTGWRAADIEMALFCWAATSDP